MSKVVADSAQQEFFQVTSRFICNFEIIFKIYWNYKVSKIFHFIKINMH